MGKRDIDDDLLGENMIVKYINVQIRPNDIETLCRPFLSVCKL